MALVVGKQSNLNDLVALKAYLETQIEEAKAIKVNAVDGSEVLAFPVPEDHGKNFAEFASPAMTITQLRTGSDVFPSAATGAVKTLVIKSASGFASILSIEDTLTPRAWIRGVSVGSIGVPVELLTSANTITDANGFIKAA